MRFEGRRRKTAVERPVPGDESVDVRRTRKQLKQSNRNGKERRSHDIEKW